MDPNEHLGRYEKYISDRLKCEMHKGLGITFWIGFLPVSQELWYFLKSLASLGCFSIVSLDRN